MTLVQILYVVIAIEALVVLIAGHAISRHILHLHQHKKGVRKHAPVLHPVHPRLSVLAVTLGVFIGGFSGYVQTQPQYVQAVTASTPTNPLPFDLPSQATLKGSSKKVFAHYFTPYPISLDNYNGNQDYYATQYTSPNGEGGKFSSYGGFFRQRPLIRGVDSSPNWELNDMKTEVRRATNAGLDGFTVDMLGLSGTHWDRLNLLIKAAAEVDSKFKIVLMPDSNAPEVVGNVNTLASKIATLAKSSNVHKLGDGRLVVSPFYPEVKGASYWNNFVNIMRNNYGIEVAFVPCFLNYANNVDSFAPFSYGYSVWGNRNPAANSVTSAKNYADDAHRRGKIWMQPVSMQDVRPTQQIYDEANNTENLRLTWQGASAGADWVQIPTWNDYSEGTEISPSVHTGYGPLDISSYYLTKFKTATSPAITRDVVYVSHRVQPHAARPTGGQARLMSLRQGSSPARDTVEVLSFLRASSAVSVKVGSNSYNYTAPAGVFSKTFPLANGGIKVSVARSGSTITDVSSITPIASAQPAQDLQYYFVSSGRDGKVYATQQAPAPTTTPDNTNTSSSTGTNTTPAQAPSTPTKTPTSPSPSTPPKPKPTAPVVTTQKGTKVAVPDNGDKVVRGTPISLSEKNVTDEKTIASIDKVEYFEDENLIATVDEAPFTLDTSTLDPGEYTLREVTYPKDSQADIAEVTKDVVILPKSTDVDANSTEDVILEKPEEGQKNSILGTVVGVAVTVLFLAAGVVGFWWVALRPNGVSPGEFVRRIFGQGRY